MVLWTLLICIACIPHFNFIFDKFHDLLFPRKWLLSLPLVIACLSAPVAGWIADVKFGNYRTFKSGVVLLFFYTALNCLSLVLEALFWQNNTIFAWIQFGLSSCLLVVGTCIVVVTSLPLGLDQMPDASAHNITSFIAWFVFSPYIGSWLTEASIVFKNRCLSETLKQDYFTISSFLSTLCMSIVLISSFLLSPKWVIIEPKSPQSLRAIYRVLKFAAKHETPLNCSAFTVWEEDMPSRVDIGKSKYGGPFTTKQVEDVKTILRLLAISLPLFLVGFSLILPTNASNDPAYITRTFPNLTLCSTWAISFFTYNPLWCAMMAIITYEFAIYPLIRNKLPSILKRIGTVSLMMTLVSFVCFFAKLGIYLFHSDGTAAEFTTNIFYHVTNGVLSQVLTVCALEFVCAQAPNNMRGFFASFFLPLFFLSIGAGYASGYYLASEICSRPWCSFVLFLVKCIACLIGFILFCVVARWYKMRVRCDDRSPQRVVEEVCDRNLIAAAGHQFNKRSSINT